MLRRVLLACSAGLTSVAQIQLLIRLLIIFLTTPTGTGTERDLSIHDPVILRSADSVVLLD